MFCESDKPWQQQSHKHIVSYLYIEHWNATNLTAVQPATWPSVGLLIYPVPTHARYIFISSARIRWYFYYLLYVSHILPASTLLIFQALGNKYAYMLQCHNISPNSSSRSRRLYQTDSLSHGSSYLNQSEQACGWSWHLYQTSTW
jgi:hypothetical protein